MRLPGSRGEKEGVFGRFPVAAETQVPGDGLDRKPGRFRCRVNPGRRPQQHDFAHLEFDLTHAWRRLGLGAEAAPASGDDRRILEDACASCA